MPKKFTFLEDHFYSLDVFRGLSACVITFHHFAAVSPIFDWALVRNCQGLVDLFFVLSGFVIAHSYLDSIHNFDDVKRYLILRFARVYPLHFTVLMIFVAIECLKFGSSIRESSTTAPFVNELRSVESLISNIFLAHSFGIHTSLNWNMPSWSVGAEFYVYIVFGVALVIGWVRKRALLAMIVGCMAVIYFNAANMDTTYQFGFVRCLYGFSLGILSLMVYRAIRTSDWTLSTQLATLLEVAVLIQPLIFTYTVNMRNNQWGVISPLVYAPLVLVFAFDRGLLSRGLNKHWLAWLGAHSYSIYITHFLVISLIYTGAVFLERKLHWNLTTLGTLDGQKIMLIGTEPVSGTIAYFVMFLMTLWVSHALSRLVENPCRQWGRRLAKLVTRRAEISP